MSAWSGPPLFLIGAARSGTTMIGDILRQHPQLAYWDEPKYVWRHGRAGARDDVREAADATPKIAAHVRRQFENYTRKAGRPRFVEKTPSNCFRVGFMHAVFPEGLFLNVVRDGRDAAASALKRWRSKPDDRAILRRIRNWEIPLAELHLYAPDIIREGIMRRLQPQRGHYWGPRFPGMVEASRDTGAVELCARQWVESARHSARELARIAPSQVLSFRYEDFVREPEQLVGRILEFAGLPVTEGMLAAARSAQADRVGGFGKLPEDERTVIESICLPAMRELGIAEK